MENKFKLSHVVLYAKGWYKQTDDMWADLQKILELDNYTPFDKMDVYNILVSATQNSKIYRWTELSSVLNGIHPSNSWKVGYYINENKSWVGKDARIHTEYDMPTAFVYYVLSNLRFMDKEHWNVVTPKYRKYPKAPNITVRAVYEHFGKQKLV